MLSFSDMHVDIAFYILIDKQSLMVTYSKNEYCTDKKYEVPLISLKEKKRSDDEFNL